MSSQRWKIYFPAMLMLAILVMVNMLAARFSYRVDFTEEKQFTLSEATSNLLQNLESPVTVRAYFSDDLPPDFLRARQQFKDLLIEYSARSNGKLVYEFINPNKNEEVEKEIIGYGIQPVIIEVRDRDQKKQQKAYLSAIVEMHETRHALPFLAQGSAMEYELSSAIKKLSQKEKPTIAFLQGNGEPALEELVQTKVQLEVMYDIAPYFIAGGTVPGPDRFAAMIWLRPTDTIPQSHFNFIDEYLAKGGRLMLAYNPVEGDFVNMVAYQNHTGIGNWLAQKGVQVKNNLVIDDRCGSVSVQQNQGTFAFMNNVSFPFLPLLQGRVDNEISGGLEAVMLEFPSEIEFTGDSLLHIEPTLQTSARSATLDAPQILDINREWTIEDFNRAAITTAVQIAGNIAGDAYSRMVVIADGDLVVNGPPAQARQVQPDNINLFVNSVDWLVDDTGLIQLRSRGITARPLNPLSDQTKSILRYGNFLAPMVLVVIYGLIRSQRKRTLRKRRMEEDYTRS